MMRFIFPFSRFSIEGDSMAPMYQTGDRVLVFRWGAVRSGDTVVFSKNGMTMVKRAVNKEKDRWIVRGENFSQSTDSLDFGSIEEKEIIGRVAVKY